MNLTPESLQNFFQSLAEQHPDVAHGAAGKRSFARLASDQHIDEITKNGGPNIICVVSMGGGRTGDMDDKRMRWNVVLRFASYASAEGDQQANRDAAVTRSHKVMTDVVARIEKLYEDFHDGIIEDCDTIVQFLEPDKVRWAEIPDQPWLTQHFGWDLTIPVNGYTAAYDAALWGGSAPGGGAPSACPVFQVLTAPSSANTIGVAITENGATEYRVQLLHISDDEVLQEKIIVKQQGVPPGTSFTGLTNATPFRIRVSAKVDGVFSDTCAATVAFTPMAPGCEVVQLTPYADRIRVYWLGNNQSYIREVVLYSDDAGTDEVARHEVHAGAVGYEVFFEDLQPGTDYWVRVQPADRNTGGEDNLCGLHQTKTL